MIKWGILLLVIGAAELILPHLGFELKVMRVFGELRLYIGIAFAAAGVLLIAFGLRQQKQSTANHADNTDDEQ